MGVFTAKKLIHASNQSLLPPPHQSSWQTLTITSRLGYSWYPKMGLKTSCSRLDFLKREKQLLRERHSRQIKTWLIEIFGGAIRITERVQEKLKNIKYSNCGQLCPTISNKKQIHPLVYVQGFLGPSNTPASFLGFLGQALFLPPNQSLWKGMSGSKIRGVRVYPHTAVEAGNVL